MEQCGCGISEASKQTKVDTRVLRYWEEELELKIPRNAMGHRYYREEDLETIQGIKQLKSQGFQLKAIKLLLPNMEKVEKLPEEMRDRLCKEMNARVTQEEKTGIVLHTNMTIQNKNGNKLQQAEQLLARYIKNAIVESTKELSKEIVKEVNIGVAKEMDYQFRMQEERQEAHFRRLDEAIRTRQKGKRKKRFGAKG